jgi:protein-L-isoaspartate(D-aspartate) O-methyltransferase
VAEKHLKKPIAPEKPKLQGLRTGTRTTQPKAPNLVPRWGASVNPTPSADDAAKPSVSRAAYAAQRQASGMDHGGLSSERTRVRMVERLMAQGIRHSGVLEAMRAVPRHQFVDEALASRAYEDTALPIGHQQTMSQPYVVARVIELALGLMAPAPSPSKALELGTGCGYQAAVMSHCFGQVISVERIRPLADLARANLRTYRRSNLRVLYGDGIVAAQAESPFDVILCSAGMTVVPPELLAQLKVGGVMVAPVGDIEQRLVAVQRVSESEYSSTSFDLVRYVPVLRGTES